MICWDKVRNKMEPDELKNIPSSTFGQYYIELKVPGWKKSKLWSKKAILEQNVAILTIFRVFSAKKPSQ